MSRLLLRLGLVFTSNGIYHVTTKEDHEAGLPIGINRQSESAGFNGEGTLGTDEARFPKGSITLHLELGRRIICQPSYSIK